MATNTPTIVYSCSFALDPPIMHMYAFVGLFSAIKTPVSYPITERGSMMRLSKMKHYTPRGTMMCSVSLHIGLYYAGPSVGLHNRAP